MENFKYFERDGSWNVMMCQCILKLREYFSAI